MKHPSKRWAKVRNFLLDRIKTQIPLKPPYKHANSLIFERILDRHSFIAQCLSCVALFNAADLAEDTHILMSTFPNFYNWVFTLPVETVELEVQLRDGSTKKAQVPEKELHSALIERQLNNVVKEAIEKTCSSLSKEPLDFFKLWERILEDKNSLNAVRKETGINLAKEPPCFYRSTLFDKYFPECKEIVDYTPNFFPRHKPENHLLNAEALSLDLAELFIRKLKPSEKEDVFFRSIERIGYKALRLSVFQEVMKEWEEMKQYGKIEYVLETLVKTYSPSARKKAITERKQYRFLVMVSQLLEQGYSKNKASNKVAKELNEDQKYVRRQYYNKEKEIKELGLSLQYIKEKYGWTKSDYKDLISDHYKAKQTSITKTPCDCSVIVH